MGIEPTSEAWEALNKTLKAIDLAALSFLSEGLKWKLNGNRKQLRQVPNVGNFGRIISTSNNPRIGIENQNPISEHNLS
jgi:hypothetical protein